MSGNGAPDLTRWNRAGLSRFRYVDGNAVTFADLLRRELQAYSTDWRPVDVDVPEPGSSTDEIDRLQRLLEQYDASSEDVVWNVLRAYGRACHVLTEHLDAYANESYLETATQWDNVRRLVAMLGYRPKPPASAYTTLVLYAKDETGGLVEAGFGVRYAPEDGGDPVVFETLEDLEIDPDLDALRPASHNRNPAPLSGRTLTLDGSFDKLATGQSVVLEDERTGRLEAYVIRNAALDETTTRVEISPRIGSGFVCGATIVHASPGESLELRGPIQTGATIGRILRLSETPTELEPGEVLHIGTSESKPRYHYLTEVRGTSLVLSGSVGESDLENTRVSRPVELAISHHGERTAGTTALLIVYVAGDWTRLIGKWVATRAGAGESKSLPMMEVTHADYTPAGEEPGDRVTHAGYTALTLAYNKTLDGVPGDADLEPLNTQRLLVPPATLGPWRPDLILDRSRAGDLAREIRTEASKKAAPDGWAVIARGEQVAWTRLGEVTHDDEEGTSGLTAPDRWQHRGGGPFYVADTRAHTGFSIEARPVGWETNDTPLRGSVVPLETLPESLMRGRRIVAVAGTEGVTTQVEEIRAHRRVVLADPVPDGATHGSLVLHANAVLAGHGESRPGRVLGSGDGTLAYQSFTLEVEGVSFVADDSQTSGVAAAMGVEVDGRQWQQVGSLKDSGPADTHYEIRMTEAGYVEIAFGDGVHGRRLPTGSNNVRGTYRQGTGAAANVPAGSLVKPARAHRRVDRVEQPIEASGGADMESATTMRESAPGTMLTLGRAVSLSDMALLARQHSSVVQARAFSLPPGPGQRDPVEIVVIPTGGGTLTPDLIDSVESFVTSHAVPGVGVQVSSYDPVLVGLSVLARVDSEAYDPEAVREAVVAALIAELALDARRLGQSLYRGEIYRAVEAVTGVENSRCEIVFPLPGEPYATPRRVGKGADGIIRAIHPEERQCIHLPVSVTAVDVTTEEFRI